MVALVKDFIAFVSLSGFCVTALTWMDIISNFS